LKANKVSGGRAPRKPWLSVKLSGQVRFTEIRN